MKDRFFSLWMPGIFALLIFGLPAAIVIAAYIRSIDVWNDPAHQAWECRTAAAIALDMLAETKVRNARLYKAINVVSILRGEPPTDGLRYIPRSDNPQDLDCRIAFLRRGVPHHRYPPNAKRYAEYTFSRLRKLADGAGVVVSHGFRCGALCGNGVDAIWARKAGHWVIIKSVNTWVS